MSNTTTEFKSYAHRLAETHAGFVGDAAQRLHSYVRTLHSEARVDAQPELRLIQDWDWGTPVFVNGGWRCRVWSKDGSEFESNGAMWEPNLEVCIVLDARVAFEFVMGNTVVLERQEIGASAAVAADIGIRCGEVWEKLLTGRVRRSRDDR